MGTDPFVTCSDTVAQTGATLDLPAGKGISCCVGSTKPPAVLAHGDYSTLVLISPRGGSQILACVVPPNPWLDLVSPGRRAPGILL